MSIFLLGGGTPQVAAERFINEALQVASQRGESPAVVILRGSEGPAGTLLRTALLAAVAGRAVTLAEPGAGAFGMDPALAHGVAIAGEQRAQLLATLSTEAEAIREAVSGGAPYLGLGNGAAIAGDACLTSGSEIGGVLVGPATERGEITLEAGLGLIDLTLEADPVLGGTLPRLIAAVEAGVLPQALAVDAHTALIVGQGALEVAGPGSVWQVTGGDEATPGVTVQTMAGAGQPPR